DGRVTPLLYVQGADIDVGAVVTIGGVDVPTAAHRALRNDLYGMDPNALGYPIYHYVSLLAAPGTQAPGSTIMVAVRNLGGQTSAPVTYKVPTDEATLDSDGDNIPDQWEKTGYDADGDGIVDVDLKALGADPFRRDVLVEVDVMTSLANPPTAATFSAAQSMFNAAPILNPMRKENGIN